MDCDYYAAGRCRSCTLLEQEYETQVLTKQTHCRDLLAASGIDWLPAITSPRQGFRNKAKLVVGGSVDDPTLGILDAELLGVDLRECPLHTPGIRAAIPTLARFVNLAALTPYDVKSRRGELKHVLVTESPDGELMVRFVLRSREALPRIRKHLDSLHAELPLRVATANLQPEHKAVLEGPDEIVLTEQAALPMRLGTGTTLLLRPQSFFQTNTGIATALYRTATAWADELAPRSIWDLYCGVGGFALHLAGPGREVLGIEVSSQAVESARAAAAEAGLAARFEVGDATTFAFDTAPELVVLNPPRRGIGPGLASWLEASSAAHVLYSSCRAETLARDLESMPSLRPTRAVVLDMFPNTSHYEVLIQLDRF